MANSIVLMDGKNCLFRHHYANMMLSDAEGFPTGAIHGAMISMLAMSKRLENASFVWVWDGEGETWRHRMMNKTLTMNLPEPEEEEEDKEDVDEVEDLSRVHVSSMVSQSLSFLGMYNTPSKRKKKKVGYKANRVKAISNEQKRDKFPTDQRQRALLQMPVLRLILEGTGFRNYQVQGLEGDDLLAMLAQRIISLDKESTVYIHSGDRDFYQLLTWPQVRILLRLDKGKLKYAKKRDIEAEHQVSVKDWTKYRALTGDASDNIPHLWKVGPVTARKMLDDGLDPSKHDYRHIPDDIQVKYGRYFQPHGIAKMWSAVYGNYKLCQLVTDPESDLLSEEVKERLESLFDTLTVMRKFRRKTSLLTPESYRKVSFLLNSHKLAQISNRLDQIWRIS